MIGFRGHREALRKARVVCCCCLLQASLATCTLAYSVCVTPPFMSTEPSDTPEVIGIVGLGLMTTSIARGLPTLSTPPRRIIVSPRGRMNSAAMAAEFPQIVTVAESNQMVASPSAHCYTPPAPCSTALHCAPLLSTAIHCSECSPLLSTALHCCFWLCCSLG